MTAVGGLGDFLRARRGGIKPVDVGLPAGTGLRRTPGLRREELAALAGVSIDYYIRLEQGRENNPSLAVLDSLADALMLDEEERTYLHALARPTVRHSNPGPEPVRSGIHQLRRPFGPAPPTC